MIGRLCKRSASSGIVSRSASNEAAAICRAATSGRSAFEVLDQIGLQSGAELFELVGAEFGAA